MTEISRRSAQVVIWALGLFAPAIVGAQTPTAQTPWAVTLTPTLDPLPVGFCAAIQLTVLDATGKDAPRNALGARVTIADFDISVTGNGVVAQRIDAYHWVSCACQSAKPGSTATVTASYPSRSLPANAQLDVKLQRAATFTISAAKGTANPPACTTAAPASPAPPTSTLPQPLGVPAVPRTPPAPAPTSLPVGTALPPAAPPPVSLAAPPAAAAPSPAPVTTPGTAPRAGTLPQPIGVPAVPRTPSAPAPAAPPVGVALPPTAPPVALAPVPINPSGFTAVQIAPGQVRLSWQAVSGASFYGLFGPGLTAGGEKIVGATTFVATNVPAGSQQWAVGSFIDPGNISTLASEFPRVTLNVTPPAPPPATAPPAPPVTSGHYRVVATRFTVDAVTIDNLLDLDGKGDEIYGGFSMFHVNRINGQVLDQDLRRTKVHGQVMQGTDRVAAGSATANGGLVGGDNYPSASSNAAGGDQTFPFLVWDGTLKNNQDAVVLLPSLWESDNDDENFDDWFLSEQAALPVFWWDADMRTALTTLGLNVVTTDTLATGFGFNGLLPLTSKDRPVGLTLRPTGFALRRRAIVLTREILEAALTPAPASAESQTAALVKMMQAWRQGNKSVGQVGAFAAPDQSNTSQDDNQLEQPIRARPGENTIAVPLVDSSVPNLHGSYILYLRVERVP